MGLITNNKFTFQMDYTGSNGYQLVTSVTSLNDNAWHTVIVTGDGTTNGLKMYVDGVLESTASAGKTATMNDGTYPYCGFGYRRYDNGSYLSASVSDIGLFPVAFTAEQVSFMTNALKSNYPYAFRRSLPKVLQSKLWGWYDGTNDGTYIKDLSGNGRDLTMVSSPTKLRAQQNGLMFTNGSNSYAWRSEAVNFSQLTIAQWAWTDHGSTASRYGVAFCADEDTITNRIGLRYCEPSTGVTMDIWSPGFDYRTLTSLSPVTDGKIHFIAGTKNGTSGKLYFDGSLHASGNLNNVNITGPKFAVGGVRSGASANSFLSGKHETFIFDSELTAQELQMLRFATYRN